MFDKKAWVLKRLKSGFDTNQFTAEFIMTTSMKYSMAGVLDDEDLSELATYTEPVTLEEIPTISEDIPENDGLEEGVEESEEEEEIVD